MASWKQAGATLALGVSLLPLAAQPSGGEQGSIEALKTAFLQCDEASRQVAMDSGAAAHCSVIYERLKASAFGGDWEKLRAWWSEAQAGRRAEAPVHAQAPGGQPAGAARGNRR